MTLFEIIELIKEAALSQPNVRTCYEGSVYDLNADLNIDYDVVVITQDTHRESQGFAYYRFHLFFVTRLMSDLETNRLQGQSGGMRVLSNIIRTVCDSLDIEVPDTNFTTFSEKFSDECCGVYCSVEFEIPIDDICAEEY